MRVLSTGKNKKPKAQPHVTPQPTPAQAPATPSTDNFDICPRCKRLFHKTTNSFCRSCVTATDPDFVSVRDYLYSHPRSTIGTVSAATGVPTITIQGFVDAGRLIATHHEGLRITE